MVRVFLKGGVWKNSEDEILKAAVQKYGTKNWARVASLLNQKTAKQAKARWHEWLDPTIRKTEWSRSEEEKLLQLAKLLPAQWKTIAPMLQRTAVQCQEHYEYLLDQAASGSSNKTEEDTTRKQHLLLRPGQIDSHPESKAAKPDAIDMEEEELEMLQEARARLANTQGKKAKRKQREKVLLQAKRLAELQKRRELKQAGLLSTRARKKSKTRKNEIDFGVEIPFYKPAPVGIHDTSYEQQKTSALLQKRHNDINYHRVNENLVKTRDREEQQIKKKQASKLRILEQSNEKYANAAKQKQQEQELPSSVTFRGALKLPPPSASSQQQQQSSAAAAIVSMGDGTGSAGGATATLLQDMSKRPLPTPMRGGTSGDNMQGLASELRQLERGQTPLLSSAHTAHADDDDDDRKMPAVTDNNANDEDQHSVYTATTAGTAATSIRDLARAERRAAKRARAELEQALQNLPTPQYEYELLQPSSDTVETVLEEDDDAENDKNGNIVMDQGDVERAQLEQEELRVQKEYEARSSVLKRGDLPRPPAPEPPTKKKKKVVAANDDGDDHGLEQQVHVLLQHDAYHFPILDAKTATTASVGNKKKRKKRAKEVAMQPPPPPLEKISEESLEWAKQEVETELQKILDDKVAAVVQSGQADCRSDALEILVSENARVSIEGAANMVYLPDKGWIESNNMNDPDILLPALRHEFSSLQQATASMQKKNDKMTAKLATLTGGYAKRAEKLRQDYGETVARIEQTTIEQASYERLRSYEQVGGASRIQKLKDEIQTLKQAEAQLQKRYGDLVMERRRMQAQMKKSVQG